jgi:hypothetical protein
MRVGPVASGWTQAPRRHTYITIGGRFRPWLFTVSDSMPIHLYTNKHPHIATKDLPGGRPAQVARHAKDVLQHGMRFGKAVVLFPRHLKQQIFNGGPKRWIDPSRKQWRKSIQRSDEQVLNELRQRTERDRLEAAAKAASPTGESQANDRGFEAVATAVKHEKASAASRKRAAPVPNEAELMENRLSVQLAFSAYQAGLKGLFRRSNVLEADFHAATRDVLMGMVDRDMIEPTVLTQFEHHCAERANEFAADEVDPSLPEAFKELKAYQLICANVGQAWFQDKLVAPPYAEHMIRQNLDPNDFASDYLFTPDAIEAWQSMSPKADKA